MRYQTVNVVEIKKGSRFSLPSSRGGAMLKADPPDPVGMRYQAVNVVEIKKGRPL
jgi:hypothetical protein